MLDKPPRPQFSLKAILVIIAVLAVPLGMMVSGDAAAVLVGRILAPAALLGCIGYLIGGSNGAWAGAFIGLIANCLIPTF